MNIPYLVKEIIPQRQQEIAEGKNLSTRQPIYVVLDLQENICSGHSDYTLSTNYKGKEAEFGFIDEFTSDSEKRKFKLTDDDMKQPEPVTRFFTDRFVAFFLTSKAAHDYLKYQAHNLTGNEYVYVFYSGYGNKEMNQLLDNDKYTS